MYSTVSVVSQLLTAFYVGMDEKNILFCHFSITNIVIWIEWLSNSFNLKAAFNDKYTVFLTVVLFQCK